MRSSMCLAQPSNQDNANATALLDRIAAMLTKPGQRGYAVYDTPSGHSVVRIDTDTDSDSDPDTDGGKEPKDRQGAAADALPRAAER